MPSTFQNRLVEAMRLKNIKASELAKKTGLSKAQISQYTNGIYMAKQTALYKLAVALDVSEAWLMGHDVPMNRLSDKQAQYTIDETKDMNPDIRMIARAGRKMTPEDAATLRKVAQAMFPEVFKDGE